jgi:hypothetical protein
MIFAVNKSLDEVEKIEEGSFVELNIWERQHIEEWVRTNPEILGEELLIVSSEFDRFVGSSDRLDVLAVDRSGNLVVIELKRDPFAGYADLQAVRYAAMVSSMTIDGLVPHYVSYRKRYYEEKLSDEEARTQIVEFVETDSFEELSNQPRIILCSEGFSQEITTTVLWLRQSGIDVSCVVVTPYQVEGRVIVVPKKIIPLAEATQYSVGIQRKEEEQQKKKRQVRRRTLPLLLEHDIIKKDDRIFLSNGLPAYMTYDADDLTFHATITGKLGQSNSVRWDMDGQEYSISSLTWQIFKSHHPEGKDPGGVNGNWHWVNESGVSLWSLAEEFLEAQGPSDA